MRLLRSVRAVSLMAMTALLIGSSWTVAPASAATLAATTTCANGVDNTGGLGLICEVTIVNTITTTGGSSIVTVRECHGAAGDPEAACVTDTQTLSEPVTVVDQCNAATNGGGGTLRCSVRITNLFDIDPAPGAVTVNQCVGSGDGDGSGCDPFPATTTGATLTQCNGSANGGTLVQLTCTASGTESSALDMTINQCNDSTNGGGGLVICSAEIENRLDVAAPTATPAGPTATPAGPTAPGTATPSAPVTGATPPPTDMRSPDTATPAPGASVPIVLLALVSLVGLMVARRRPLRR